MIGLFVMTAFGGDALPGLMNPSAVPMGDSIAQVEANLGLSAIAWTPATVGSIQGAAQLGPRVRVGAAFGGVIFADPRSDRDVVEGAVNAGLLVVDEPNFRLTTWMAIGSYTQVGFGLWWELSDHLSFDYSGGPAFVGEDLIPWRKQSWQVIRSPPPYFNVHRASFVPELGLTFALDPRGVHSIRVGLEGPIPNARYRVELGAVALEVQAVVAMFGVASVGGISMQL